MRPDISPDTLSALAYQDVTLTELRSTYDRLDLEDALEREKRVEQGVSKAEGELDELRALLLAAGADIPERASSDGASDDAEETPRTEKTRSRYAVPLIPKTEDFSSLVALSEAKLKDLGVDTKRDPLLQVVPAGELGTHLRGFGDKYGDVSWDRSDYMAVMLASFLATLVDIFLVRIPTDKQFLGTLQQSSPLTKWLREKSPALHEGFLENFEKVARVTYDDVRHPLVDGMRPDLHRLESLGHDPILGFIFGTADLMRGTGTFIDKYGDIVQITKAAATPETLISSLLKVFFHLLSDVCTSAGIQPPFFTLLQLVKTESPFVLSDSGVKVSWTDVSRYMYANGYDLRHFFTMGLVPATVEIVIRGWWLLNAYTNPESSRDPKLTKAKLTSMLLLGHTIATSGNLLKTGLVFGMNPLAMNWAQMLAMFPATLAWLRESALRERRITGSLDREWKRIYVAGEQLPD